LPVTPVNWTKIPARAPDAQRRKSADTKSRLSI
jgi:hypothetical protein